MLLKIRIVDTETDLIALETEWNDLLERSSNATIYTTFEWVREAWNICQTGAKPFILKFYDGVTLVGIIPLRIKTSRLGIKVLQHISMGLPHLSIADMLDTLSATGYEEMVIQSFAIFVKKQKHRWDTIDWQEVPSTSSTSSVLLPAIQGVGLKYVETVQNETFLIKLPATWDEFLSQLSTEMRNTIKRKTRKILREQNASFERISTCEEVDQVLLIMRDFIDKRWEESGKDIQNHEVFDFGRKLAPALLKRGWLDLNVIKVDNRPIAINWNFRFRGMVYYFRTAFDLGLEWRKYSPGIILLAYCIEQAIKDNFHSYHLLRGQFEYKVRLGTRMEKNYWFCITHQPLLYIYYRNRPYMNKVKAEAKQHFQRIHAVLRQKYRPKSGEPLLHPSTSTDEGLS